MGGTAPRMCGRDIYPQGPRGEEEKQNKTKNNKKMKKKKKKKKKMKKKKKGILKRIINICISHRHMQ